MKNALKLTELLRSNGYEAYLVGGCVRDMLAGEIPHDFDMTTSALTQEMLAVFSEYRVIETGIKHGTLTVLVDGKPYEITTFRSDGEYGDHRHPKNVVFSDKLSEDLSRRDFTVNAMAYSEETGIIDLFGGREDIKNGVIRAIGEPSKRFDEDALRILRALRFASEKGFCIEKKTEEAIFCGIPLLSFVSAERIFSELKRIITGKAVFETLTRYSSVAGAIVKPLLPCIGFKTENGGDLYTEIVKTVSLCRNDAVLRLAALLCRVGKPFATDGDDCTEKSAELAFEALSALKCDNKTRECVITLIKNLNLVVEPTKKSVLGAFRKIGIEKTRMLIDLKEAIDRATGVTTSDGDRKTSGLGAFNGDCEASKRYGEIRRITNELATDGECFSLSGLAVNGSDIASLGIKQKNNIGRVLNLLLDFVIEEEVKNDRASLLSKATEIIREKRL